MSALLLRLTRLSLYLTLTVPLMPVQAVALALKRPLARRLPRVYHGWTSRLLGFRIQIEGERSRQRPTLFIANHTSYVDIEILGALIEGCFVAKSEVARWPLFGWLAKLQRTVFVDRRVRSTAAQRDSIRERLDQNENLILFPEGTANDGNRVLPFKSALFSVADYTGAGGALPVQPVSIVYARLDGIPLGRSYRPFFAWYGDMELAPHLWHMLGLGTVEVVVTFHPPVTLAQFGSRKALAEHCYRATCEGVSRGLAGRSSASASAHDETSALAPAPAQEAAVAE